MILKEAIYILILLFTSSTVCFSQEPNMTTKKPTLKEIETKQDFQEIRRSLNELERAGDNLIQNKKFNCLKAFGNADFCNCLVEKLPIGLSFRDYIMIITSTKEEIGYDKLSKDDRDMVDMAVSARDLCVQKRKK